MEGWMGGWSARQIHSALLCLVGLAHLPRSFQDHLIHESFSPIGKASPLQDEPAHSAASWGMFTWEPLNSALTASGPAHCRLRCPPGAPHPLSRTSPFPLPQTHSAPDGA